MHKAKICYEQNKNRSEHTSNWKGKRTDNYNQGRKNNRFSNNRNSGNNYKGYRGSNYKGNPNSNQPDGKGKESGTFYNKNSNQREPLKCWDCGEPHYFKDCPNKKKGFGNMHSI